MHYKFDLEDRLIDFAVRATDIAEILPNTRVGNHIAGQLVRSSTSPALNYGEAKAAESSNDFIHKMKVSLKELKETLVCLKFIQRKKLISDNPNIELIMKENGELVAIFMKSISTAQQRLEV